MVLDHLQEHGDVVTLTVPASVLRLVIEHAIGADANEACGIIAGPRGQAGDDRSARRVIAMANVSANPAHEFLMDSDEQRAAYRAMDERDEDPVALYHSHPIGPAVPSMRDLSAAKLAPSSLMLILGRTTQAFAEARVWSVGDDGRAVEHELVVTPEGPAS